MMRAERGMRPTEHSGGQEPQEGQMPLENRGGRRSSLSARRRRNRRRYYRYEILSFLAMLAVVYLVCVGLVRYVGQKTVVDGSSMSPTLEDGDVLIVDKLSYRLREPERFDVVVFQYLYKEDSYYIKRIIGLPGETVQIIDGEIYIDGALLEEDFGNASMTNPGRANQPITLGPDEYFVLGDNRNISSDSRDPSVANVAREQIVGRAFVCVYPWSRMGFLQHDGEVS